MANIRVLPSLKTLFWYCIATFVPLFGFLTYLKYKFDDKPQISTRSGGNYACTMKHVMKDITHGLVESSFKCEGEESNRRRCWFKNVFIVEGAIWVVSDNLKEIPNVLCSAADKGLDVFIVNCRINLISKQDALLKIIKLTKKIGGPLEMPAYNNVIAFARLNPLNPYHVLFEESIPLFEILKIEKSDWLVPTSSQHPCKLLLFEDNYGTDGFSYKFWNRFLPHVSLMNPAGEQLGSSPPIIFAQNLIAGSNSSCSHYGHCTRGEFSTFGIAVDLRNFIFNKMGIDYSRDRSHRQPSSDRHQPRITFVQRQGVRTVTNLNILLTSIHEVAHRNATVVFFEELSLDDQIRVARETDIMIMVHGGALWITLFLPPGATLIDIHPYCGYDVQYGGLVNWMRYSMAPRVQISHEPFEIIRPDHMSFENGKVLAANCLCATLPDHSWFHHNSFLIHFNVAALYVDPDRFTSHFEGAFQRWRKQTNYVSPLSMKAFQNISFSTPEPWYLAALRNGSGFVNEQKPSCLRGFELNLVDPS